MHWVGQAGDALCQRALVGVPGARAHRSQRGHLLVTERHDAAMLAHALEVEMRAELVVEALAFSLVDAQQPERAGQLGKVSAALA